MLPELGASGAYPLDGKVKEPTVTPSNPASERGRQALSNQIVHGFVHKTRRDGLRRGRRSEPDTNARPRLPRSARQPETMRDGRDRRRMAHNPEVEGSNPSPATKFAGQRPLPVTEEAFNLPLC
jgi:hypothetical protein